jgi:calcineurin-like phosphoesterase family protein
MRPRDRIAALLAALGTTIACARQDSSPAPGAGHDAELSPSLVGEVSTSTSASASWTIAVVSDLHIPRNGSIPTMLRQVVAAVIASQPRVVVVTGDLTDGDPWDLPWRIHEAPGWWRAARQSLEPIRARGIPVLPIAGNHDSSLPVYRMDCMTAWDDLDRWASPLAIRGNRQSPHAYLSRR